MNGGLVAQTLNEDRDLNSSAELFEEAQRIKVDPEMVQLAVQLIERQSGRYDPSDLEDRYETRLRAMIDAKLAGAKLEDETPPVIAPSNVIDLMAALKKSLGGPVAEPAKPAKPARKAKAPTAEEAAGAEAADRGRQEKEGCGRLAGRSPCPGARGGKPALCISCHPLVVHPLIGVA